VEGDIREARQSIWNLRSPRLEQHDLPSTLKEMAEQAVRSTRTTLTFEVRGAARRVAPLVEEQLLRIGGEAAVNAVRHGNPSRLDIALVYGSHDITLRVADDGRGFVADVNRDFGGHFGLTTMRERAESVGGSLRIESAPGLGTTITASVPAP
jgi:signal transduction histidine kinase